MEVELTKEELLTLQSCLRNRQHRLIDSGDYPERRRDDELMHKLTKAVVYITIKEG